MIILPCHSDELVISDELNEHNNIEVIYGNRPKKIYIERPPPSWKRVKRDNKLVQALILCPL